MKRLVVGILALMPLLTSVTAQTKKAPVKAPVKTTVMKPVMKNLLDSFSYAVGLTIADNMKQQGVMKINPAMVQIAIADVFQNKPKQLNHDVANAKIQEQIMLFQKDKSVEDAKNSGVEKAKGRAFFAENIKRSGVTQLPNGLQYEILTAGDPTGKKPGAADTVVVHYAGTFIDGKSFDNSIERGEPATFPVGGVIRGWTEILQMMTKGAKWKVYIPSDMAYGDGGRPGIPPGATLIFEINLLDIKPAATK